MTFATDLYNHLSNKASIVAEVGDRIYPGLGNKDEPTPYITFEKISDPPHNNMLAASPIANPTYQFNVWAESNLQREVVSEVLRNALDGLRGVTIGTATAIRRIFLNSQSEDIEEPTDGSQAPLFRAIMDFEIWYVRGIPTL